MLVPTIVHRGLTVSFDHDGLIARTAVHSLGSAAPTVLGIRPHDGGWALDHTDGETTWHPSYRQAFEELLGVSCALLVDLLAPELPC